MLTLIHAPNSRSLRFLWMLEELGTPYDVRYVGIKRGDGSGDQDPNNPHPHKQVPALIHDGVLITESAAIALYLTDAFPAAGLGPVVGDPKRGPYLTWLAYYAGVLEPAVAANWRKTQEPAELATFELMDNNLKTTLEASPYLLGDTFSAADIMFVSMLQFSRALLPPHKVYDDYLARLNARPALARGMAKNMPAAS